MIMEKISNAGKLIWTHKKKAAAGCVALVFVGQYLDKQRRDAGIRSVYCREAAKHGLQKISPETQPRRVTVLVNVFANEHKIFDSFKQNALPLLNLAGLEVNVIKTEDADQMEAIAGALDTAEADALYVVGGDGSISRVLTGIFRNREQAALPIGLFPGGTENRFITTFIPNVFAAQDDVRRYCESAMALIEDSKREVVIARCDLDGFEEKEDHKQPIYGLSDLSAGWFLHMEMRKKKLWYWGGLKRRFAYLWENLKRYPEPMELQLTYEDYCPGCNKCRASIVPKEPQWRWWHALVGKPKYKDEGKPKKDYSAVVNENCGKTHEVNVKLKDFHVQHLQKEDGSALRIRAGGEDLGRWGFMREGWNRCSAGLIPTSPNPAFYSHDFMARMVHISLITMPSLIRRLSLFGEDVSIMNKLDDKKVSIQATDKRVQMFVPSTLRWTLDEIKQNLEVTA